jgi:hypothetical protein
MMIPPLDNPEYARCGAPDSIPGAPHPNSTD